VDFSGTTQNVPTASAGSSLYVSPPLTPTSDYLSAMSNSSVCSDLPDSPRGPAPVLNVREIMRNRPPAADLPPELPPGAWVILGIILCIVGYVALKYYVSSQQKPQIPFEKGESTDKIVPEVVESTKDTFQITITPKETSYKEAS